MRNGTLVGAVAKNKFNPLQSRIQATSSLLGLRFFVEFERRFDKDDPARAH
jgi:hypothetical protein